MNEETILDLYLKHLSGMLTDDEITVFDQLASAPEHGTRLAEGKNVLAGIRHLALGSLKEKLNILEEEIINESIGEELVRDGIVYSQRKKLLGDLQALDRKLNSETDHSKIRTLKINNYYKLAIAASFLLAAIALTWMLKKPKYDTLFMEEFSIAAHTSIVRSGDAALELETSAYSAYDNENYFQAVGLLDSLIKTTRDSSHLFYIGVAQLAMGNPDFAISTLLEFLKINPQSARAKWYLALGHLRLKNLKEARYFLNDILRTQNDYTEKADNLLKKL